MVADDERAGQPTLADLDRLIAESREAGTEVTGWPRRTRSSSGSTWPGWTFDGIAGPVDSLPPGRTGRTGPARRLHAGPPDQVASAAGTHQLARATLGRLGPREYDVVLAVARGRTNAEIGADLYMSVATVKTHISHIMTKLDLTNRTQIALLAHDAHLD